MNIDYLAYFVAVVNQKSISKAAEYLHITQSALTQILQRLEQDLDCVLLIRSNRGVEPTNYGLEVLEYAKSIVGSYEALKHRIHSLQRDSLDVVVKHCCSLNNDLFPHVFFQLQNAYPEAKIAVEIEEKQKIIQDIEQGACDFGLFLGDTKGLNHLSVTYLGSERIVLVAGKGYPVAAKIRPNDLLKHKIIDFTYGSYVKIIRNAMAKLVEAGWMSAQYHPFLSLDSLSAIKSLVQKNTGMAFLPISAVYQELENNSLHLIEVHEVEVLLDIKLVSLPDARLSPSILRIKNSLAIIAEGFLLRYQIC